MAAYASLLSLMHLIEQIQRHPDPPVPLDPEQAESLSRLIGSLQRFLEVSHSRGLAEELRGLESRIVAVAHAAEDVIEYHAVHKIVRALASSDFYKTLPGVIQAMEFIQEEVERSRDKSGVEDDDHRPRGSSSLTDKVSQIVVGFDDISIQIMDRMTRNQSKRDIIALVGMGGAGKTTLARSIYERQLIVDCFEMRLWVTISEAYSAREVLTEILLCQGNHKGREALDQKSEGDLGNQLYQSLCGRRYLIVMDDVWKQISIQAWHELKFFFPDNNNGSRIMITTRWSELASDFAGSPLVNVDLWDLFCRKAFADGSCPLGLEEIGRTIVPKCRGLPLSIVTIFFTVFLCISISDSIMAAYASLLSLMHLIEQIQRHPDPPVPLDPDQAESLSRIIGSLQLFLEDSHSRGLAEVVLGLESRIADVAHKAEDEIESHAVRKTVCASASTDLYKTLQGAIQNMESIEEEVERSRDKLGVKDDDHRPRRSPLPVPPLGASSRTDKTSQIVVGFDDISIQIMDRMTRNQSKRDIIALVGMGGVGKTTLARSIYERQLIVDCFEKRLWVTISQQWSVREVLTEILHCRGNQESEEELGTQLYQSLIGRRYLIVMDDIWSIEAWDKLRFFFPGNNNGSRIMITTRLSELASDLAGSPNLVNVNLLDEDNSWYLFCKKAFVHGSCPLEVEEIGRKIARKCGGLPLSIVTIGGLLAKSDMTREHLEYIAGNMSSLVNSEEDERCLSILSLSYVHLPIHLKPCFLYMGLFPEDERIKASHLIRLWVAEGFVKPISGKALEAIGEDYLKDLVDRNLVLAGERGRWSIREIKYCFIHDLLRDLCIREARKENFLSVVRNDDNQQVNESIDTQRRIAVHWGTLDEDFDSHSIPYPSPFLRTCIIGSHYKMKCMISLGPVQHRLIRILAGIDSDMCCDADEIIPLANLRFLSLGCDSLEDSSSTVLSTHWNLQTINVSIFGYDGAQLDIWKMSQLRHARFIDAKLRLSDPPPAASSGGRLVVLENLQTLSKVENFECSEEVVKRIPNIKKLRIFYGYDDNIVRQTSKDYCLNNLRRLQKLESLEIWLSPIQRHSKLLDGLTLPFSLKKLHLCVVNLDNEMMCTVIGGSLPSLQVLMLSQVSFAGDEWNPVEDQFRSLRRLELYAWNGLKHWNADSTHFPSLEHLSIEVAFSLEEFPSGIRDIETLESIELVYVSDSVVVSAKRMQEVQEEDFGNDGLFEIRVSIPEDQAERLKSLASNNFKIICLYS